MNLCFHQSFTNASFSFCNYVICVVIVHLLSPTLRAISLNWSTTKPNPSSTSMLFTSSNSFVLFVIAMPFLLGSWWNWLSFACCGKNLYSPCGIISFSSGCKLSWSFCCTISNGYFFGISSSISCCKISFFSSWWYHFPYWCPISPIWLMITTTSSSNIGVSLPHVDP